MIVARRGFWLLVVVLLLGAPASFAQGKFEFLGERKVGHGLDRDEIRVTAAEGRFSQIKLAVRDAGVVLRDVKVHFGDGSVQDVQVRKRIAAGGETRVIDLQGEKRVIEKVVFWYNTKKAGRRRGAPYGSLAEGEMRARPSFGLNDSSLGRMV